MVSENGPTTTSPLSFLFCFPPVSDPENRRERCQRQEKRTGREGRSMSGDKKRCGLGWVGEALCAVLLCIGRLSLFEMAE